MTATLSLGLIAASLGLGLMGKPVRAVLRGLGGSNLAWLPGRGDGDVTSLPDQIVQHALDEGFVWLRCGRFDHVLEMAGNTAGIVTIKLYAG